MRIDNSRLTVEEKEITGANMLRVKVGTTGYKGGDGGHGGVTYFELRDEGNTAIEAAVEKEGTAVKIILRGDSELDTFIEALEFAASTLKKLARHGANSDLPSKINAEIGAVATELDELAEARWDQRESKSGATRLRERANRIVLGSKRIESLVKENTFPAA
jgi:hypothetical protein